MTKIPLFKKSEKELTSVEIEEFKSKFNLTRFPTNLQILYQNYNGGMINVEGPLIYELFSIKYGADTLEEVREDLLEEDLIPEEYLVFGGNEGGDFFAIDIGENSKETYGQIFFIRGDTLEIEMVATSLELFLGFDNADQF